MARRASLRPAPAGTFLTRWQDRSDSVAVRQQYRGVNLLRLRLNDYADAVPRLTQDPAVPFTNNLGE